MAKRRRKVQGDCFRQALAQVLGRTPHRVPDFVGKYKGAWCCYFLRWAARHGYVVLIAKASEYSNTGVKRWIEIGTTKCGSRHAITVGTVRGCRKVLWDGGNPLVDVDSVCFVLPKVK